MKKILLIILFNILCFGVYAQSIGEYSLIHIPTGQILNILDSAELFFNYVGEKTDLFKIKLTNNSGNKKNGLATFKGKFWEITVQRVDYKMTQGEKSWMKNDGVLHPETDFNFLSITVSKDFKTIRGIEIGDNINKIIDTYSKIKGYKKRLEFYDNDELNENLIDFINSDDSLEKVRCLVLREPFCRVERSESVKPLFYYYLVFNLDKKQNVSEIKIFIMPAGI